MALKKEQTSDTSKGLCKLAIDEELTIYVIDVLKQGLSAEIDLYETFELNLASVEEVDSSGIQLLLALRHELMSKKKVFRLTAMSSVVAKLVDLYGVNKSLKIGAAS